MEESDKRYYQIRYSGKTKLTDRIISDFHYSACGCLFSLEVIEKFNLRFPDGLCFEDAWWHWAYFSQISEVYFIKEPVYRYFRRPVSIMSQTFEKKGNKAIEHLYVTDRLFDFWLRRNQFECRRITAVGLLERHFWFSFRHSQPSERLAVLHECSEIIKKYSLDVTSNEVLSDISEGNVLRFFPSNAFQIDTSGYATYLQIKSVIGRLFPHGTRRRRVLYNLAKATFKFFQY